MESMSSLPKQALQAFMHALSTLDAHQIQALVQGLASLPKEQLQAFFKALGSMKPEQIHTLIQVLSNLSAAKLQSFFSILKSLDPDKVQSLLKNLVALPKESLELILNSPKLLLAIANLSPKNLQAFISNISNLSPAFLKDALQLLQSFGLTANQMRNILNSLGKLINQSNKQITEEQLLQALKLKVFSDKPELMKELLKLLNSELKAPKQLDIQLKALQDMKSFEESAAIYASASAGADKEEKTKTVSIVY